MRSHHISLLTKHPHIPPGAPMYIFSNINPRHIRPCSRLGHSVGTDLIPCDQWKKELFLLLLCPPFADGLRDEVTCDKNSGTGSRDTGELFDRYNHREHVTAKPAIFFLVGDGRNT